MPSPAGAQEAALAADRDKTPAQAQKPAEKVGVELGKGQRVRGRAGIADLLCRMALSRLLHSPSLSFPIQSGEQLPLLSLLEDDACERAFSGQSPACVSMCLAPLTPAARPQPAGSAGCLPQGPGP